MISNDTIDLLMAHGSCRDFNEQEVSPEGIRTILECTQKAPTSSYLQAYTIINVEDVQKREALMEYSGGQEWVVKAPLALLFCADLHRIKTIVNPEDKNVLHNEELFTVAVTDAALAGGRALIAAQALGMQGVIVGGIRNEVEKAAKLFELPELVFPMFLVCIGYSENPPSPKPRMDREIICGTDKYPEIDRQKILENEKAVSKYFSEMTGGRSTRGWIDRCGHSISTKPRYNVGEFLHKAGFMTKNREF